MTVRDQVSDSPERTSAIAADSRCAAQTNTSGSTRSDRRISLHSPQLVADPLEHGLRYRLRGRSLGSAERAQLLQRPGQGGEHRPASLTPSKMPKNASLPPPRQLPLEVLGKKLARLPGHEAAGMRGLLVVRFTRKQPRFEGRSSSPRARTLARRRASPPSDPPRQEGGRALRRAGPVLVRDAARLPSARI